MKSNQIYRGQSSRLTSAWICWVYASLLGVFCGYAEAQALHGTITLDDAERIAIHGDPLISDIQAQQQSFQQQSIAAGTWPDPTLKLGVMNLSTDTFVFEDEAMTQTVVGITQRFPPWGAVGAKSAQMSQMAGATGHEAKDRELKTRLAVRKSWLEMYYQYQAEKFLTESIDVFDQLKEITRLQYRSGRGSQMDVVRAQLEKSLLQDQQTDTHTKWESAIAQLNKWLGREGGYSELDTEFPELATPLSNQQLKSSLEQHPSLLAAKTRVNASEKGVDYAHAQARPGWTLDLQYGQRGAERADLGSAMIMVDLPFFSGNRQDRQIKASQADLQATQSKMDERRRLLIERLDVQSSTYNQLDKRLSLYETQVMPEAKQNTEASLAAYQSGVADFGILARARLTELNSQLQYLKLKVDKAKAQVELLYLGGS